MKTIILILLLATAAFAQNAVTGSLEYQQKPIEKYDIVTNAQVVRHEQKLSARLSAAYNINGVNVSSTTLVNLSDIKDISVLLNFTIPLP